MKKFFKDHFTIVWCRLAILLVLGLVMLFGMWIFDVLLGLRFEDSELISTGYVIGWTGGFDIGKFAVNQWFINPKESI